MGISLAQYATVSNYAFASVTAVLFLACLAYLAQWAFARTQPVSVGAGRGVGAGAGAGAGAGDGPVDGAATDSGEVGVTRYDIAGSIGTSLTGLSWLIVLVGVVSRGLAAERVPWGNMYEFAGVGALLILSAYLVLDKVWGVEWLGPIITGFCVVMLGLSMLVYVPPGPLVPALHSYWLVIHVLAAMISGTAFLLGAAASVLYLIKSRAESRVPVGEHTGDGQQPADNTRQGLGILWRMPAAARIDSIAYRIHAFAFPVWTFAALIAGPIWAQYAWGRYWGWDPKEVWAFITWVIYAGYLHARVTAGWKGQAAAIIALIGFVSFLFNFVGVNLVISGLHSYAK